MNLNALKQIEPLGKSKKYRARVCETYSEGAQCEGNAVEYVECRQARCPTWTEWTQFRD